MRRIPLSSRLGRWTVAASCGVALTLGAAGQTTASSMIRMDLAALSVNADRIFVGTVTKKESHFVSPKSQYIVTDVTLVAEQGVLGVPEASAFVVRHLGGEVGKLGQRVYGEASYRVGERVMLFAVERQGSFYSLGMAQGVLHVYVDPAGVARVETALTGAKLVGSAESTDGRKLDEVIDEARAFVAQKEEK